VQKPKVAIFGDIYARNNDILNQDLIRFIEANGGEVITTPFSYFARMVAPQYLRKWMKESKYMNVLSSKALLALSARLDQKYYPFFERIIGEPMHNYNDEPKNILSKFNIAIENHGESVDNILKVHYLSKFYPDLSLFVQTSPGFCCASLITEAMSQRIQEVTGIPMVSLTYDGTGGNKNETIIPYLKYPKPRRLITQATTEGMQKFLSLPSGKALLDRLRKRFAS